MSDFFGSLVEALRDEDTSIVADGCGSAEFTGYIDTGCLALNAVLSGSIFGGAPNNKVGCFAGESSVGKTFFVLGIVKHFLDMNPTGGVVYYDTEAAVTRQMMETRGIDTRRVIVSEPDTIQKFRHHVLRVLDNYGKAPAEERPPMLMVLDSLGVLSTTKELEDTSEGRETKDMTRASVIRATFRTIRLKLAKLRVPLLMTNHVYAAVGAYVPTNEVAGGGGVKYSSDYIALISKSKDRDGKDVVGNIITVRMSKSRLSKENAQVKLRLSYRTGLDRYYGLLDIAEKYGVFKKVSSRYELPDGRRVFGKQIEDEPEKYYTEEVLAAIDAACRREFSYGIGDTDASMDAEVAEIVEGSE